MAISMGFLPIPSQESFLLFCFVIGTCNPLFKTYKKMNISRHLVDKFYARVIYLDRKATICAHRFLQKLGDSRSCFVRYWLCLRTPTETVSTIDKVAISINLWQSTSINAYLFHKVWKYWYAMKFTFRFQL